MRRCATIDPSSSWSKRLEWDTTTPNFDELVHFHLPTVQILSFYHRTIKNRNQMTTDFAPQNFSRIQTENSFISDRELNEDSKDRVSLDSGYWNSKYKNDETGWDLGSETEEFKQLRLSRKFPFLPLRGTRPTRILVPGCGFGYDAIALAKDGYDVTAIDIADLPFEQLQLNARAEQATLTFRIANFFEVANEYFEKFDIVLEYTFYCAIVPELRNRYFSSMATVLAEEGRLVMLLFPLTTTHEEEPPFQVDLNEAVQLGRSHGLELVSAVEPLYSHPKRSGRELLLQFKKSSTY